MSLIYIYVVASSIDMQNALVQAQSLSPGPSQLNEYPKAFRGLFCPLPYSGCLAPLPPRLSPIYPREEVCPLARSFNGGKELRLRGLSIGGAIDSFRSFAFSFDIRSIVISCRNATVALKFLRLMDSGTAIQSSMTFASVGFPPSFVANTKTGKSFLVQNLILESGFNFVSPLDVVAS